MKREDLRVGGVYKHCGFPLLVACTAIGKYDRLEGVALNSYNGIERGYVSDSWFVRNFEPFDISLSLEQGGDLNHWRKVSEELPDKSCEVLVKDSMVNMYIAYFSYGKFQLDRYVQISGDIIEWKPID